MAYTIAPAFAAHCNFALRGSIKDIVSGNDCLVTGTVTASSDDDGDYIVASASSGLRTPAPLPRMTRGGGGVILAVIKYTGTGAMAISGVGETGTSTIESVLANTGSNANISNGNAAFYLRATTGGNARCGYTTGRSLNNGALQVIAVEIPYLEGGTGISSVNMAIGGAAVTPSYNPNTNPVIADGTMEFAHGILCRNLRGTLDTFAVGMQLYMYARLSGTGYDLEALTADPYQIFVEESANALEAAAVGSATATAELTTGIALAAAAAGTATATADLTVGNQAELQAAAVGSATATAALSTGIALAAAAAGSASATADLTTGAAGTITTAPLANNAGSLHLGVAVHWSWYPAGRIGALAAITPTEGTGTTDAADGTLTLTATAPGLLIAAVRNTDATDDDIYYQAFA